jgi:hypothetical protein
VFDNDPNLLAMVGFSLLTMISMSTGTGSNYDMQTRHSPDSSLNVIRASNISRISMTPRRLTACYVGRSYSFG